MIKKTISYLKKDTKGDQNQRHHQEQLAIQENAKRGCLKQKKRI